MCDAWINDAHRAFGQPKLTFDGVMTMQDFHFFAAMPSERKSKSASKAYPFQPWTRKTIKVMADNGQYVDCVAVYTDRNLSFVQNGMVMREAIAGVYERENSPVCSTSVSSEYLRKRAVRIDETTARKLHPALFDYLEA